MRRPTDKWRLASLGLALAAMTQLGLLPFAGNPVREGNRLFDEGKYDDAKSKYGEALIDEPDSPLINFNMGTAHYKAGNYADAIASFSRVATAGDPQREAAVAYNIGNSHFQMALAAEADKPQEALKSYAEALIAYRRALGSDANATDAKYNYELVLKKAEELRRRLEEQKQQQEQDQQQQQEQQQEQQQQEQQEQQEQQQQDQQGEPQDQQQQQEQAGEPEQQQQEEQPQQAQGEPEEPAEEEPSGQEQAGEAEQQPASEAQAAAGEGSAEKSQEQRDAAALIDMAADEELQPNELIRRTEGARVVEPAQDW
ncbi:MAG TPA: tetratricopeptide repeat protein [Terriglobales bacterium]|nr:tetratricopeptide repeat protein [Terriglobales bacterium]